MGDNPFADLIPQGGAEQGGNLPVANPTPVTQYSIPASVGGADEEYDSGTAQGYGSVDNELAPGVVAVNPRVYPIGTIFKDANTGEAFVAGDKHGNPNPNVIDIYTSPSQYTGASGQRNLVPVGQIPANQIPKTAGGVGELLKNFGKVPEGEGAYTSIGKIQQGSQLQQQQMENPFADLIPKSEGVSTGNVFDQALSQYPKLKNANAVGLMSTNSPDGENMLESWPAGEIGTSKRPRPKELPQDKLGVQIFSSKTTPDDVAADIVSHQLVKTDPTLKATYDQFASSLTPEQKDFLKGDYENEVKNEGETRSFDQWMQTTGVPSAFRGYAFGQYDPKAQQEFGYTDQQKQLLGNVKLYLQGDKREMGSAFTPAASKAEPNNPFADLIPSQQASSFGSPFVSSGQPQTFGDVGPDGRTMKEKMIPTITATKPLGIMEQIGRGMSGLLGPTEQQRFEESVPVRMPDGSVQYQYKPFANRLEKEQGIFTPFVEQIPQFQPNPNDPLAIAAGKGVLNATAGILGSFMSPGGVLLGGVPKELEAAAEGVKQVQRGAAGLFAGQMLSEVPEQVQQAANEELTPQQRIQAGVGAVAGLGLGALAGKHAIIGEKPPAPPEPKPEPTLTPSANPVVNEREAQINAAADAQSPIPETPKPAEETPAPAVETPAAPAPDISSLLTEQLFHEEGSPEHTAIQQQIDQLKQPAEAPAEAQPTQPNAIQEPSATEAMLRPQVTGQGEVVELSGVGEQKPEVPAKEAEAPKEEVVPKTPYDDIQNRYYEGGENAFTSHEELANEVERVAKKQKNKPLLEAVAKFREAIDVGADMGEASNKLMDVISQEADLHEAGNQPKPEKVKPSKRETEGGYFGATDPVIQFLQENPILSKTEYLKRVKSGKYEGTGGEYDDAPAINRGHATQIYSPKGRPIDQIHAELVDLGLMNKDSSVFDLWSRIEQASKNASKLEKEEAAIKKTESERIRIEKLAKKRNVELEKLRQQDKDSYVEQRKDELKGWFDANRRRSEGGFIEFPDAIKEAAVKFGDAIRKAGMSFRDWSGEMVNRLGEGVRNFLHRIYNAVSTGGGRFLERGAKRGAIDLTGEERFKPKAPTEQEAFAKKAVEAFTKGRGTPPTEEEMQNILSRKFPGITSREASDIYATATGKPKAPTPYAGVAVEPSGEKISIRTKDQEDQVRRGILTSSVPTGEGTSRQEILDQGNANLRNGDDPYQALEKAKQGDFNALTTAKAYAQALAKQVSEALKKYGPVSKEYKDLAKKYQDYYEGIREAGTVASDILRTFQGETDFSDAADIAREYTKITGEEPSLGKHEQIRKVADKVDTTIKQAGESTQKVRDTLDESLADVDVKTPESVEESQQQIADLSDASGKKAKDEIERLNNELEQTKRDLEEVRQAKETSQDAESLRRYYEAKLKDLNDQLVSQPKYGKEVFETARKIVDKWKADSADAEKLLRKQLSQMGSSPDPTIILTLARIMRAHIGELALDFTKSSAMLIEKFGPKIKPFLKDAWAKAQELIKGEDGGEKAVKSVRKATAKAKPVEKMTPEEKAADSLRKRIAQAQKKIDDLNSGKVTTPKEVEKVTNDEINRLESEYEQKKKELADARLKAKQRDLFAKDKLGENLNPEQVKTLWETAKKFYLDKGEQDWDKMVNDLASDLGLTPDQVRKGLASPKGARRASDEMYLKQRSRQIALDEAKRWLTNQKASWIGRIFGALAEKTFKLAIFGHGTAFIGTHAPSTLYTNPSLAFKAWLKGFSYTFSGKNGQIKNIVDNKDLIYRPNWTVARRAGLENDPRETRREGATPARSDTALARALDTISGGRGFDALFHLRQDMFDQAWNQLSVTMRNPEMAEMIADSINNATGFTKGGERTKGILQSPITKILFFAPKLIASRFKWMIQDPAKMLATFAKMANPFAKVTPEERISAIYEAKNKAKFLGLLTGTLLANQALLSLAGSNQKINFTNPKKNDWLAYKGFGYSLATIGAFTRIARLIAQEYNAIFGQLSRIQKARGGREAAMKDAIYTYLRSGFSPITRDIIVGATGKDYLGNVVPWSNQQPDRGRRKLNWGEIIQEQFAPIPLSEAATQKEPLPAAAKAASAAFLGTRLETPADIAEYEKSLQAKQRRSSGWK